MGLTKGFNLLFSHYSFFSTFSIEMHYYIIVIAINEKDILKAFVAPTNYGLNKGLSTN